MTSRRHRRRRVATATATDAATYTLDERHRAHCLLGNVSVWRCGGGVGRSSVVCVYVSVASSRKSYSWGQLPHKSNTFVVVVRRRRRADHIRLRCPALRARTRAHIQHGIAERGIGVQYNDSNTEFVSVGRVRLCVCVCRRSCVCVVCVA